MARYTVYKVETQETVAYCVTLERALAQVAWAQRTFDGVFEILESAPGIRRILDAQGQWVRDRDDEA